MCIRDSHREAHLDAPVPDTGLHLLGADRPGRHFAAFRQLHLTGYVQTALRHQRSAAFILVENPNCGASAQCHILPFPIDLHAAAAYRHRQNRLRLYADFQDLPYRLPRCV